MAVIPPGASLPVPYTNNPVLDLLSPLATAPATTAGDVYSPAVGNSPQGFQMGRAAEGPQVAPPTSPKVAEVQGSYLFKFANLVEWPHEDKKQSLNFAVVGDQAMQQAVKDLDGKLIRGLPVRIVKVDSAAGLRNQQVDLLYFNPGDRKGKMIGAEAERLNRRGMSNTLTVKGGSGREHFSDASIQFRPVKNRVRFAINVDAVRRASLKISPRLVKVGSALYTDRGKSAP